MTFITTDLSGYSLVGKGSYTGNDTTNRAIPHGLGKTPKAIFIGYRTSGTRFDLNESGVITTLNEATSYAYAVTPADATNFYVGNAAVYSMTANGSGVVMDWVAFG